MMPQMLLWEAEFEIERAEFGPAAGLIKRAKEIGTSDSAGLPERRLARLYLAVGRLADAQALALEGRRWDGKDTANLNLAAAMDFVTLGEISLDKGNIATGVALLLRAISKAKNASSLDGVEWTRAQADLAIAYVSQNSLQSASQAADSALSAASREWGSNSIPAMDALDTLGLVQMAEHDFQNAEISLARSRSWRETVYQSNHPKVAESYQHAALLYTAQDQMPNALQFVRRGLEIEKALIGGPNGRWALALLPAAEIFAKAGQYGDARTCYESAIPILEPELGHDAPRLESARGQRAKLGGK